MTHLQFQTRSMQHIKLKSNLIKSNKLSQNLNIFKTAEFVSKQRHLATKNKFKSCTIKQFRYNLLSMHYIKLKSNLIKSNKLSQAQKIYKKQLNWYRNNAT